MPACGGWKICAECASGRLLRNVGICPPNYTASYTRRLFLQGEKEARKGTRGKQGWQCRHKRNTEAR